MNLDRAIEIGHILVGINSAISEGKTAYSNAHLGGNQYDFYDTPLFEALSLRREVLRVELNAMNAPVGSSPEGQKG